MPDEVVPMTDVNAWNWWTNSAAMSDTELAEHGVEWVPLYFAPLTPELKAKWSGSQPYSRMAEFRADCSGHDAHPCYGTFQPDYVGERTFCPFVTHCGCDREFGMPLLINPTPGAGSIAFWRGTGVSTDEDGRAS
jgi:hypothetical protein